MKTFFSTPSPPAVIILPVFAFVESVVLRFEMIPLTVTFSPMVIDFSTLIPPERTNAPTPRESDSVVSKIDTGFRKLYVVIDVCQENGFLCFGAFHFFTNVIENVFQILRQESPLLYR